MVSSNDGVTGSFLIPGDNQIMWSPQFERRYRFNRKDGKIYIDLASHLREMGDRLDMLILQHHYFTADLFNKGMQDWVLLAFLDSDNVVSIAYLNSGATNAVEPWYAYVQDLYFRNTPLASVVTRIQLQEKFAKNTGHTYYSYRFHAFPRATEYEKKQYAMARDFMLKEQPIIIDRRLDKDLAEELFSRALKKTAASLPKAEGDMDVSDAEVDLFSLQKQ